MRWKQLTGLDFAYPSEAILEQPIKSGEALEQRILPLLAWRQAQLDVVKLDLRQNKERSRAATLSIGLIQIEGLDQQEQKNSWQIGLNLPFGSSSFGKWRSGYRAIGEVEVQLKKTQRMMVSEQQRIVLSIKSKQLQLSALTPLKIDLEANFLPRYQAYKQGRIGYLEWLPIQQSYWDIQQQVDLVDIELKALQSQLNHLQGVTP